MKTICFWCGKSHKVRPKKCVRNDRLMSAVCKKVETFKVMRVLEVRGIEGLEDLAIELGLYRHVAGPIR